MYNNNMNYTIRKFIHVYTYSTHTYTHAKKNEGVWSTRIRRRYV